MKQNKSKTELNDTKQNKTKWNETKIFILPEEQQNKHEKSFKFKKNKNYNRWDLEDLKKRCGHWSASFATPPSLSLWILLSKDFWHFVIKPDYLKYRKTWSLSGKKKKFASFSKWRIFVYWNIVGKCLFNLFQIKIATNW